MQDFKADILSVNKKGRLWFYSLFFIVLVGLAVLIFLQIVPIELQLFSLVIWGFAILKYVAQSKKNLLKKPVGDLIIVSDHIQLFNKNYSFNEVTSIKINVSGWKSYKRSADRNHPVSNLHNGDKNFLAITTKDKTIKCEFFLSSGEHWQLLKQHVLNWYLKEMNVYEEREGAKTYGLEVLNYQQIQEFKIHVQNSKVSAL